MSDIKIKYLGLEGVDNARELGGLVMQDGRRVKFGKLFRTGFLNLATVEDIALLSDTYHLRHIYDFRTEAEVLRAPDCEIPGSDHIFLPTIDPESEKKTGEAMKKAFRNLTGFIMENPFEPQLKTSAYNLYPDFVYSEYTQLQYAAFLNFVLNSDGPVLWHCSQGKDRTGLGAIFILESLGASRETIMADFSESNVYWQDLVDVVNASIAAKGASEPEFDMVQSFIGVNVKNMQRTLDMIDRDWGSLHNYITQSLLFSDEEMFTLREKYLE